MNLFKKYLIQSSNLANEILPLIEEESISHALKVSERLLPEIYQLLDCFKGGKRIRQGLVQLGFELTDSAFTKDILFVGLSYDLFHSSILIHDDIIDDSIIRRGKPTAHVALGNNHYGRSQAICMGDLGFFIAQNLIRKTDFADDLKLLAISQFNETIMTTILGEMLDIKLSTHKDSDEKDLLSILKHKTAHYTVRDPLLLGVLLGKGDFELSEKVKILGEVLGIALQIKDDINGVFLSSDEMGKPNSSDIQEGKLTYLSLFAFQNGTAKQKAILNTYFGKGSISVDALLQVAEVFRECGALDYAYEKLNSYVRQAKELIKLFPKRHQDILNSLVDYTYQYK